MPAERTPGPLVHATLMGTTPRGEMIFHCGLGLRGPRFSTEQEANAAHLVHCWNAHDDMLAALKLASEELEFDAKCAVVRRRVVLALGAAVVETGEPRQVSEVLALVRAAIAKGDASHG